MLKAILVDDEKPALRVLSQMIAMHTDIEVAATYTKPSEALEAIRLHKPDVVFLDIEMPGMNGIELAGTIIESDPALEIVFVTAFSNYALQAFRVSALDYLLKPVAVDDLLRCVRKLKRRSSVAAPPADFLARAVCFGGFDVYSAASADPIRFPTAKVEELLAYLMTNRESYVPKWTISDCLWPDTDPDKAEQNLHTTVYRLKKTLLEHGAGLQLESQRGSYRVTGSCSCDYTAFNRVLAGAAEPPALTADELASAVASYKGSLFGVKDYAWCIPERERLQRHYCALAKKLAAHYAEAGDDRRAADTLHAMLAHAPFDEEGHELLLGAYLRLKDRASFVLHYDKWRALLHGELGLDPSAAIVRMVERMNAAE